jgi:hypothetical protein
MADDALTPAFLIPPAPRQMSSCLFRDLLARAVGSCTTWRGDFQHLFDVHLDVASRNRVPEDDRN